MGKIITIYGLVVMSFILVSIESKFDIISGISNLQQILNF